MRVISPKAIREFSVKHTDSASALQGWYLVTKRASWRNLAEVKADFPSADLTAALGGYEWARWEHFWLMMGYLGFFVIHIAQVVRAGWPNFRSMVCGYDLVETGENAKVTHGD